VSARARLASLWLSQSARVLADWCLRLFAVREGAVALRGGTGTAWYLATALFIAPFLLLSPLNGCVSNALPRRAVLVASAGLALVFVAAFSLFAGPWLVCLALVGLAAAVYSPARSAVLPAAAHDARLPLPRVSGLLELGAAAAILGGVALGQGLPLRGPSAELVLLGLGALCLLTALPAAFPTDVPRPEPPGAALRGFFRDAGRIVREREALAPLLGLSALQALVTAGSGALIAEALGTRKDVLTAVALVGAGAAAGCARAAAQGHPRRSLGQVPWGAVGLVGALLAALALVGPGADVPLVPCVLLGLTSGLVNVPLRAAYLEAVPEDARGNAVGVLNAALYLAIAALAGALAGLAELGWLATPLSQLALVSVLAALAAAAAWWLWPQQALEAVFELLLWPMYNIRARGPGAGLVPRRGPVLLVANHTSYFDPFWLGKVVPRRLIPMMTSVFYDRPILRWLMPRLRVIRVQVGKFRREAPELREAVDALKRGECVLIFPEAILRRSEEQALRPFGQGAWHILREVPHAAMVACWVEGGWGSWASYRNGRPFKNKRPDVRRRIDIALAEPQCLPAEVLADQRVTRAYLMRACLECRAHLGLPVPQPGDGEEAADS
jgi:1-acyl-sn-glycerol-3-phosphate acyltransferase